MEGGREGRGHKLGLVKNEVFLITTLSKTVDSSFEPSRNITNNRDYRSITVMSITDDASIV